MKKSNTNAATRITEQINHPELAAAHKRIVVTDNANKKGAYDISIEFLRKRDASPWRRSKLVEGLTEEQAVVSVCTLRKYCVEEMRVIDKDERIASPNPSPWKTCKASGSSATQKAKIVKVA